jgi:hypothetical protein
MLTPHLFSWVKERRLLLSQRIKALGHIGFTQVTCSARERPIGVLVGTTLGKREDMINFKRDVEDSLRGVAILATAPRAFGYQGIVGIH